MIYKAATKIDSDSCNKMAKDLSDILAGGEDVIIDLSKTTYISSAGLRVLLIALKSCRAKGYDFSVVNPNPLVMEIFKTTGLTNVLLINPKDSDKNSKGK